MTPELFKYLFTQMLPEVIMHSKSQDEEQVRDHYDRTSRVFTRLFVSLMLFRVLQEAMTFTNGLCLISVTHRPVNANAPLQVPRPPHDLHLDRKSTRLNSSHSGESRMPSSA